MARRGDGIYLRGKTWWLDFCTVPSDTCCGSVRTSTAPSPGELAQIQRAAILKAEAGIGDAPRGKDPLFDDVVKEFTAWAQTEQEAAHRP